MARRMLRNRNFNVAPGGASGGWGNGGGGVAGFKPFSQTTHPASAALNACSASRNAPCAESSSGARSRLA